MNRYNFFSKNWKTFLFILIILLIIPTVLLLAWAIGISHGFWHITDFYLEITKKWSFDLGVSSEELTSLELERYYRTRIKFFRPLFPMICVLVTSIGVPVEWSGITISFLCATAIFIMIYLILRKLYPNFQDESLAFWSILIIPLAFLVTPGVIAFIFKFSMDLFQMLLYTLLFILIFFPPENINTTKTSRYIKILIILLCITKETNIPLLFLLIPDRYQLMVKKYLRKIILTKERRFATIFILFITPVFILLSYPMYFYYSFRWGEHLYNFITRFHLKSIYDFFWSYLDYYLGWGMISTISFSAISSLLVIILLILCIQFFYSKDLLKQMKEVALEQENVLLPLIMNYWLHYMMSASFFNERYFFPLLAYLIVITIKSVSRISLNRNKVSFSLLFLPMMAGIVFSVIRLIFIRF